MKELFRQILLQSTLMALVNSQEEITIKLPMTDIIGLRRNLSNLDVFEFKGIPFAKAPVGNLRFEKPEPFNDWANTLDARYPGPSCYQTLAPVIAPFLTNKNISEDCLFLNIHVPFNLSSSNRKSVMVWIHGGGYETGQASLYDGGYLAVTGDVIVVTIQYRLNVFGFFTKGTVKGNFGLWDQIMAIKWVKDNIAAFGGDNESITIFGESAGGFSVALHTIIPDNQGLFQRAIIQSGTALTPYSIEGMTDYSSSKVAELLNCSNSDTSAVLNCMKNVSAEILFAKSKAQRFTSSLFRDTWGPVVDGELFMDLPENVLMNSTSLAYTFYRSLDVVIGTVTGESSLLLDVLLAEQTKYQINLIEGIPKQFLCDVMTPDFVKVKYNSHPRISRAICEKYGQAVDTSELSRSVLDAYTDMTFFIPTIQSLRIHSADNKNNCRQFHYIFSRPSQYTSTSAMYPSWFTASAHATEILYEFPFSPLYGVDSNLAKLFMTYLTNFAKTGNVNGDGLPLWNEYAIEDEYYINFNVPITTGRHLFKDRVQFWLNDIPDILQQTSAGPCVQGSKLWFIFFAVLLRFLCISF